MSLRLIALLVAMLVIPVLVLVGIGAWEIHKFDYGANFGYPDQPVVPESAKVVVTDKGWDDDDPIRLRVAVVDIGDSSPGTMLDFYRETYPSADGWQEQKVDPETQELCLVRKTHDRYSEFVEVFPYHGSRVPAGPGLHLIMISRLQSLEPGGEEKTCGLAQGWIPSDVY